MKRILFFLLLCNMWCRGMEVRPVGVAPRDPAEEQLVLAGAREAKDRLSEITNFNSIITEQARNRYFYRLVPNEPNNRLENIQQYYALNGELEAIAATFIMTWIKDCNQSFQALTHNYLQVWNNPHDPNYRDYIYNGFTQVHVYRSFYHAIELITTAAGDFPAAITQCLANLNNTMPLNQASENERNLPYQTLLLFLSDYLMAANLNLDDQNRAWRDQIKNFFSRHSNDPDYNRGQRVIASATLIAFCKKGFKSCLVNSGITDDDFTEILKNFEIMYKVIFHRRNNYIFAGDKQSFDRFLDQEILMLKSLIPRNIVINQRLNQLERKFKNVRSSYFWWWVLLGTSTVIGGSILLFRKYPHLWQKLPSLESLFSKSTTKPIFAGKRQ